MKTYQISNSTYFKFSYLISYYFGESLYRRDLEKGVINLYIIPNETFLVGFKSKKSFNQIYITQNTEATFENDKFIILNYR